MEIFWERIKNKKAPLKTRLSVGVARFELTTSWSQTKRDTGLRYTPIFKCGARYTLSSPSKIQNFKNSEFCDPTGTRTPNRQLRRLMLYPVELSDQIIYRDFCTSPGAFLINAHSFHSTSHNLAYSTSQTPGKFRAWQHIQILRFLIC
jgi:hypothetical protein